MQGPQGPSPLHLFWGVLLGWIIVHGAGPLSIDAVLSRGLVSTAIPGSTGLGQAVAIATRIVEPWYRLALRLWIATAPLAVGAAVLPRAGGAVRMSLAPWLASYPDAAAAQPAVSLAVASLLICGLGTRAASILLALAVPISQAAMQLDERLYWLLALGILILYGPGPFALDRLVDQALRRVDRDVAFDDACLPHVVIVGGGFGGIAAARGLAGAACRITLVDRRNYHLFQPLLYQVATAGLRRRGVATPIRSLFRLQPNVRVLLGERSSACVLQAANIVIGRNSLPYDYLAFSQPARSTAISVWTTGPRMPRASRRLKTQSRSDGGCSRRSNGPKAQVIQRSAQRG